MKAFQVKDNKGNIIPAKTNVDAVDWDGESLRDRLANLPSGGGVVNIAGAVYFNSLASLKASTSLSPGDVAITKGFSSSGDGGGSVYFITSAAPSWTMYGSSRGSNTSKVASTDDVTLVKLANGLFADLYIDGDYISIKQLGGKPTIGKWSDNKIDNAPIAKIYANYCDRKAHTYTLLIPEGVWAFSPTIWQRTFYNRAGVHVEGVSGNYASVIGASIIIPYSTGQEYIWKMSSWESTDSDDAKKGFRSGNNIVKNLCFTTGGAAFGDNSQLKGSYNDGTFPSMWCKAGLYIIATTGDTYDGLYFHSFSGTCMKIDRCCESWFGYINLRNSGYIRNGSIYNLVYFGSKASGPSAVSACYFQYFNVESCVGSVFYGASGCNVTHCEWGDIQMESNIQASVQGKICHTDKPTVYNVVKKESNGYVANNGAGLNEANISKYGLTNEYIYNHREMFLPDYESASSKFYIFAGSLGYNPIIVDTVTLTNFGCSLAWVRHDADGNPETNDDGSYVISTGRQVAIVNVSEDHSSKVVEIKHVFMTNNQEFKADGPWLLYGKSVPATCGITFDQPIPASQRPFNLEDVPLLPVCNPIGANCTVQYACMGIVPNTGCMVNTRITGSQSPFGMAVALGAAGKIEFFAKPNKKYGVRVKTAGTNRFVNTNAFKVCDSATGDWVSLSNENLVIPQNKWTIVQIPTLGNLTDITKVRIDAAGSSQWNIKPGYNPIYIDCIVEL